MTDAKTAHSELNPIDLKRLYPKIDVESLLKDAATSSPPMPMGKVAEIELLRGLIAHVVQERPHLKGKRLVELMQRHRTDGGHYGPSEVRAIQRIGRQERKVPPKTGTAPKRSPRTKPVASTVGSPPHVLPKSNDVGAVSNPVVSSNILLTENGWPLSCMQSPRGMLFKSGPEIRLFFNAQAGKVPASELFLAAQRVHDSEEARSRMADLAPESRQMILDCWAVLGLSA